MKKKVFIIVQDAVVNTTGGAITSFVNISNFLSEKFEVYGICYAKENGRPKLNDNVKFINLNNYYIEDKDFSSAINHFIKDNKPDIILFFFTYLYVEANLSEEYNEIPRILLFRSRPDFYFAVHNNNDYLKDVYVNTVSQILFPSYYKLLPDFIRSNSVVCIPNSIHTADELINTNVERKKIIYLSRIDCWKGHKFLINSFSLISKKYPNWSIDIYGQSQPPQLEYELKTLVNSLNLENQIHFCGITKDPYKIFLNYDFCVFPSYFEGFPNGLSESLSVGLPAIGLKGASGVNELIIDNVNGFLVDDSYFEFANKIEILICDRKLRSIFSKNAIALMRSYDLEIIKEKWIDLISSVLNKKIFSLKFEMDSLSCKYKLFSVDKLLSMKNENNKLSYNNFAEKIFSLKKYYEGSRKKKIMTIFGIKILLNRKQFIKQGSSKLK